MKPSEYNYIRAFGIKMGSFTFTIEDMQLQASADNAPPTAVYYCSLREKWITVDKLHNQATAAWLESWVRRNCPTQEFLP